MITKSFQNSYTTNSFKRNNVKFLRFVEELDDGKGHLFEFMDSDIDENDSDSEGKNALFQMLICK